MGCDKQNPLVQARRRKQKVGVCVQAKMRIGAPSSRRVYLYSLNRNENACVHCELRLGLSSPAFGRGGYVGAVICAQHIDIFLTSHQFEPCDSLRI